MVTEKLAKKRVASWVVNDDFWARVETVGARPRAPGGRGIHAQGGGGREPKPARLVFEAVAYVLRTGCQWKTLPKERFGNASAIHKWFLEWERVGVFEAIWAAGLAEYDQMEGIAWR